MPPMRLLLDLQACQSASMQRGIGRYSLALAQALARRGGAHELHIVLNAALPASVAALQQAFDGLLPRRHMHLFHAPLPVAGSDAANGWRSAAAERVREHFLAELRPDIVHIASLFEGWTDDAITSVRHGKGEFDTAVTLYDLIPLLHADRYLADPALARWYYRKLQSLKNAELRLAISAHTRREAIDALQLPADSVVNISAAVDAQFRPLPPDHQARAALQARYGLQRAFLMYTGGIDYRKNIEGLIDAYALLPGPLRARYQLAVVCAVTAPDRQRLRRLARQRGLAENDLVLTGYVADDDLVALYNATTLFVFPSLHEGFGLPALEAMACGAAVIGSDNSSIVEMIGRADALFDPAAPAAIAAKMAEVLSDAAMLAQLRAHGLQQARRFSWDASAARALDAFEALQRCRAGSAALKAAGTRAAASSPGATPPPAAPAPRARLAFVSPLPPERSGIAHYSAELLPELARHYDIELVLAQDALGDPWLESNFVCHDVAWFDRHADRFDLIVYQFGNSPFHLHMFGLLERHPGIVVLHDFFLSEAVNAAAPASAEPHHYSRSLYRAHGYAALCLDQQQGRRASLQAYPNNLAVVERATGVIVHSQHALALAAHWLGPRAAAHWQQLALPRRLPGAGADARADARAAARARLGFEADDFVLCSFGLIADSKCIDRLVDAWLASALAADARCHLLLVGENNAEHYGRLLDARIRNHPRIRITGYVDEARYRDWLAAADAAVQLRRQSRGETSAALLDALACGLPTIANRHGAAAEIPAHCCLALDDDVSDAALTDALERLWREPALRAELAAAASRHMLAQHHPAVVAQQYRRAIGAIAADSSALRQQQLVAALAADGGGVVQGSKATAADWRQLAAAIALNRPHAGGRTLFVLLDWEFESAAGRQDSAHGDGQASDTTADRRAQRLTALLREPPAGVRVEPVHLRDGVYHLARRASLALLGLDIALLDDAIADSHPGDLLLSLGAAVPPPLTPLWQLRQVHTVTLTPAQLQGDMAAVRAQLAALIAALPPC